MFGRVDDKRTVIDRLARVVLTQHGLVVDRTVHDADSSPGRLSGPRDGFLTSTVIRSGCRILLTTLSVGRGRIYCRCAHSLEPNRVIIRRLMLLNC